MSKWYYLSNGGVSYGPISNEEWNNYIAVFNPTMNSIKIYKNGQIVVSTIVSSSLINSDNIYDLMFGVSNPNGAPSGPEFFQGKIDNIGIWNRALSQEEITNLYTAGTTFFNFCLGAKVSDLVAASGKNVKVYTTANGAEALEDIALTGTAAKPVAYYLSEPTVTGESARVLVYVTINALPATPTALVLTNDNAVLPAISTKAITAVGVYTGTNTPLKLSVTATRALSYKWTLPLGAERTNAAGTTTDRSITSTEPFIYVKFTGTGSATPLVINVQSVNASGCTSAVKASASLTRLLPAAPAALVMNIGINTTAITSFAKYMGSSTVLRLSATATPTASSYLWELPTGVNRVTALEGGTNTTDLTSTAPFIYVNFAGVTLANTITNPTVLTTLTKVLRIGIKSVNGVGPSVTANVTATSPATSSTAKLLTLTATAATAPASLVLNDLNSATPATAVTVVSKYVGSHTTLKLTAAASVLANSYSWELPSCVTRVTDLAGSLANNTSTSTDPFIYVKFNGVTPAAGSIYFGVTAVNNLGASSTVNTGANSTRTDKLLTVRGGLPAVVATVSGSLSVCNRSEGFNYTITAPVGGATSYIITAPVGSVVRSTNGVASATSGSFTNNVLTTSDLTFKVVYNGTAAFSATDKSLVIRSANAFGPCLTAKALALTKQTTCTALASTVKLAAPSVTENFDVIAYPNPSSDVFTLEVQSSGKGKATTGVQVYDMAGRLIEKQQIISNSLQVGKNYAAGIYNITVSQGNNVKTIQIIKK